MHGFTTDVVDAVRYMTSLSMLVILSVMIIMAPSCPGSPITGTLSTSRLKPRSRLSLQNATQRFGRRLIKEPTCDGSGVSPKKELRRHCGPPGGTRLTIGTTKSAMVTCS
jgi:hypothetical protein